VPGLWLAYYAARGGLGPLMADAVTGNLRYASLAQEPAMLADQLSWFFRALAPSLAIGDWPFYALTVFGLSKARPGEPCETMATLWLAAALLGALTGWFLFPHYFLQAYPALALAAAAGMNRLSASIGARRLGWLLCALCLYPAAVRARPYFVDPPEITARRLLYANPLYEAKAIGEYARARTAPDETIYVFGSETQIYVYARRRCATRYAYIYPLTLFPVGPEEGERELSRLAAAPPKLVVYSAQPFSTLVASKAGESFRDGFQRLLRAKYRWTGQVDVLPDGGRYRLGDGGLAGSWPDLSRPADSLFVFERLP
jgi:hypothetical protein